MKDEETGEDIDYSQVFTADPAALWQLPEGTEMWESGVVDLTPILSAVKDDVQHLGAVSRTPMHMLMPAGANQSAEGASMQREGLVFKVEDRISRATPPWVQVVARMLRAAGMTDRADPAKLSTIWAPANRLSLSERADAAQKLNGLLPRRTLLIKVLGFSPSEADRIMSEIADDEVLAAQLAMATGLAGPPGTPGRLGRPGQQNGTQNGGTQSGAQNGGQNGRTDTGGATGKVSGGDNTRAAA